MSKPTTTSYDPKKINVTLDGKALTAFSEDGVVTIKKNEDNAEPVVGCKGDIIYVENANETGIAEIPLLQNSSSLAYVRKLCETKKYIRLVISDANDDDAFQIACEKCRILKMPDLPRGKKSTSITVSVFIPQLAYNQ